MESPRLASRSTPDRRPIAVALEYEPNAAEAPRVVASGRGPIAERIVELARAHGIAVRENADLAEMLDAVSVGERIPLAAFAVVAEILYYVLKANGRLPQVREQRR
jgi:flagellar biosynthesis protein